MQVSILKRILLFLFSVVMITTTVLFALLISYDRQVQNGGELYTLSLTGEYSEEGGPWLPLTPDVFFQNLTLRNITVRGHFTRDLPKGTKLFLNLDHLYVALRVNETELFSLKPEQNDGNLTQALGRQWVTVVSPGISTTDTVELNFGNLYENAYLIQFDELLWQMHAGDERMMLFEALRLDGWPLGVGTAFLFLTLFLLALALGCAVMRIQGARRFLWLGITTLFSACWFFTLSSAPSLILPLPVFLNVLYAFSMQGMAIFFVLFSIDHLSGWRKHSQGIATALLLVVLQIALINQFIGVQDLYKAIDYFAIADLLAVIWLVYCVCYEARKEKNQEARVLLRAMLPLALFATLELINGFVQFSRAAILLGIGLLLFVVVEGIYTLHRIKQSLKGEKRALILENELQQNRTIIMLSQMQPHFLSNVLQSIKLLCDMDPPRASEALEHFSFYLRHNLDSLSNSQLVPFKTELSYIQDYLYLEKMRFSKKLSIKWNLQVQDFLLPPLTVQPILENAIRHGITKKKKGGTVTISSERQSDAIVITVQDDGVGFDPSQKNEDGRSHVGIENTRERLRVLCGGSLSVDSEPGVGTTAKMIFPLKGVSQ